MWEKILSDLSISMNASVSEGTLNMAMLLDLYRSTNNQELKKEIEEYFINMLQTVKK